MPKSLNDLGLKDEALPTAGQALDDLPQFGAFTPPPQPGPYRFRLPKDLSNIWDTFEVEKNGTKSTRVTAVFDSAAPLVIVHSPFQGKYVNEPFQTRFNNNERARGKDKKMASDLDYLIAALSGPATPRPSTNKGYIEIVRTYAGKEFGGDMRYSWKCATNRNIRVRNDQQQIVEVEGKPGCGEAYYQEDVDKLASGEFPLEIQCKCGALLRAFGNIDNIRA